MTRLINEQRNPFESTFMGGAVYEYPFRSKMFFLRI